MTKTNATALIDAMREFFSIFGLPDQIVSANGPPFGSNDFIRFGKKNGIKITRIPPYHPQSNGLAERAVQTIKRVFKKTVLGTNKCREMNMNELLCKFKIAYNNTPSTITSRTPSELIFSFKPRTLLSSMNPRGSQELKSPGNDRRMPKKPERAQEIPTFAVNENVLYRNTFKDFVKWIPAKIVKKVSYCTYLIKLNDLIKFVHISQIRKSYLEDKFHPDYLVQGNTATPKDSTNSDEDSDSKTQSNECRKTPTRQLRRSSRARKAPLRFDFRNYMKY